MKQFTFRKEHRRWSALEEWYKCDTDINARICESGLLRLIERPPSERHTELVIVVNKYRPTHGEGFLFKPTKLADHPRVVLNRRCRELLTQEYWLNYRYLTFYWQEAA